MTARLPALDPTTLHPSWCLPEFCEPDGPTVTHVSAPIVWRMEGSDVDVVMQRRQEGLAGEVIVSVRLENDHFPGESTLLFLTRTDRERWTTGICDLTALA